MSDFWYALKMLGITAVIIFILQIRVGTETIESHSLAFLRTSPAVESLNGVAQGAVKAMSQGYRIAASFMDANVGKVFAKKGGAPGSRLEGFRLQRSEAVESAQEKKRKTRVESESPVNDSQGEQQGNEID